MSIVETGPAKTAPKRKPKGVRSVRRRDASGEWITKYEIDSNAPNFGDQLLWVFQQGVNKAIAENEKLGLNQREPA